MIFILRGQIRKTSDLIWFLASLWTKCGFGSKKRSRLMPICVCVSIESASSGFLSFVNTFAHFFPFCILFFVCSFVCVFCILYQVCLARCFYSSNYFHSLAAVAAAASLHHSSSSLPDSHIIPLLFKEANKHIRTNLSKYTALDFSNDSIQNSRWATLFFCKFVATLWFSLWYECARQPNTNDLPFFIRFTL